MKLKFSGDPAWRRSYPYTWARYEWRLHYWWFEPYTSHPRDWEKQRRGWLEKQLKK